MKFGAVVLAGGEGRRIGGDKVHRALAGRMLIDHVLERAVQWRIPLAISVREAGVPRGFPLLLDQNGEGPIAGIASALRFARQERLEAVLTLPCDTPFLPGDLLSRLAAAIEPPSLAAVASSGGRLHPSCALWMAGAASDLPPYLEGERSSLRGFAQLLNARTVEWPIEPIDPFFNINTPADLSLAEEMIRRR